MERIYQKAHLVKDSDGHIIKVVKGKYVSKKKNLPKTIGSYLLTISSLTACAVGVLELCGRIGHF